MVWQRERETEGGWSQCIYFQVFMAILCNKRLRISHLISMVCSQVKGIKGVFGIFSPLSFYSFVTNCVFITEHKCL